VPRVNPRQFCKDCGRHRDEAGHISATGLCFDCAAARQAANLAELRHHRGPRFRYWRRQIAASVGGVLVDDIIEKG